MLTYALVILSEIEIESLFTLSTYLRNTCTSLHQDACNLKVSVIQIEQMSNKLDAFKKIQ